MSGVSQRGRRLGTHRLQEPASASASAAAGRSEHLLRATRLAGARRRCSPYRALHVAWFGLGLSLGRTVVLLEDLAELFRVGLGLGLGSGSGLVAGGERLEWRQ
eukprot:scaffold95309_cov33-Phaeocystis_antarctica.AAC.1